MRQITRDVIKVLKVSESCNNIEHIEALLNYVNLFNTKYNLAPSVMKNNDIWEAVNKAKWAALRRCYKI